MPTFAHKKNALEDMRNKIDAEMIRKKWTNKVQAGMQNVSICLNALER